MILYIYFISILLNVFVYVRKFKRRGMPLLFSILKGLAFIIIFNIVFLVFNLSISIETLVPIYVTGIIIYILRKKYICLSLTSIIAYIGFYILGTSLNISEIMFIIGFNHIFEGIFMFLSRYKEDVIYVPIYFGCIFFLYYKRKELYNRFISSSILIIYGVLVLSFKENLLFLIVSYFIHEFIIFIEKILINKKNIIW